MEYFDFSASSNENTRDGEPGWQSSFDLANTFEEDNQQNNGNIDDWVHTPFSGLDWNFVSYTNFGSNHDTAPLAHPSDTAIDTHQPVHQTLVATEPDSLPHSTSDARRLDEESQCLPDLSKSSPANLLKTWVAQNPDTLYPTSNQKSILSHETGLTIKQVSTWFANYRSRSVKQAQLSSIQASQLSHPSRQDGRIGAGIGTIRHDNCNSGVSHEASSHDVAAPSSPRTPLSASENDYLASECDEKVDHKSIAMRFESGSSDFMTSWYLTLPENDCYDAFENHEAEDSLVEPSKTIKDGHLTGNWKIGPTRTAAQMMFEYKIRIQPAVESRTQVKRSMSREDRSSSRNVRRKASFGSTESNDRHPSNRDAASVSASSLRSMSSAASFHSSTSRRGRRIQQGTRASNARYRCPECTQGFGRRSDMTRHLNTIHNESETWICCPVQRRFCLENSPCDMHDKNVCYCGSDPRNCSHRTLQCWAQAEEKRTFNRLDNFKDHLKLTHHLDASVVNKIITLVRSNSYNMEFFGLPLFCRLKKGEPRCEVFPL